MERLAKIKIEEEEEVCNVGMYFLLNSEANSPSSPSSTNSKIFLINYNVPVCLWFLMKRSFIYIKQSTNFSSEYRNV